MTSFFHTMEFLAHETAHSSFWIANQKKEEEAAKDILAEFSFGIVLPLFSILLNRRVVCTFPTML